jgi:hypothetical protein
LRLLVSGLFVFDATHPAVIPHTSPRKAPDAITGHGVRKKQATPATESTIQEEVSRGQLRFRIQLLKRGFQEEVSRGQLRFRSQLLLIWNIVHPSAVADITGSADRSPPTITVARPALLKTPSAVGMSPRAIQITLIMT